MDQQSLNQQLAEITAKCQKMADHLRDTWGDEIAPTTHPIFEEVERLKAEANDFISGTAGLDGAE